MPLNLKIQENPIGGMWYSRRSRSDFDIEPDRARTCIHVNATNRKTRPCPALTPDKGTKAGRKRSAFLHFFNDVAKKWSKTCPLTGKNVIFAVGFRKDAGVAERDGLENRCTGNCTEGSNPSLSAIKNAGLEWCRPAFFLYSCNPCRPETALQRAEHVQKHKNPKAVTLSLEKF